MKRGSLSIKYAVKIWLFSVLISPILLIMFSRYTIGGIHSGGISETYGLCVVFGGLFSIPSLLIFMGIIYWFIGIERIKMKQKRMIQIAAIILCIAPIIFIFGGLEGNNFPIAIIGIYLLTISFGIWFFDYRNPHILEEKEILDHLVE